MKSRANTVNDTNVMMPAHMSRLRARFSVSSAVTDDLPGPLVGLDHVG